MNNRSISMTALAVGLVLFFAVNILASTTLRSMRIDLTEEKLFTLSDGSKEIAANLDEPINLYFFFSEEVAADVPSLRDYGNRVLEMLEEYVLASDGSISLEVVDPVRFSEEEDRAVEEGLYGVQVESEKLYCGLLGTNSTDDKEIIAFFDPSKERFLEYDISRLIYTLAHPKKPVVGIVTALPLEGAPPNPMLQSPGQPAWQVVDQLRNFFDTRMLGLDFEEIDEEVDLLLLVHPKDLSESAQYAVDQFVLAGGKAVVYVDPWCESDLSTAEPGNPISRGGAPSDLKRLFDAWGVEMADGKVVGDEKYGLTVVAGGQRNPEQVQYVVWLGLREEAFDSQDAVTSLLDNMTVPSVGILQKKPDATTDFQPLLQSSELAMKIETSFIEIMPDPKRILQQFVPEHERLTLAARLSGPATSAFPEGPPGAREPDAEDPQGDEEGDTPDDGHLADGSINVIVVADADNLADRYWIQEERLFGQISLGYRKTSDNGDFLMNALENLAGGDDLISIRARGRSQRPFDRVEEIRRDAERRFLEKEQALQGRLTQIQNRINELQREKSADTAMILSPEQADELKKARDEQLSTRKELRKVQLDLRSDVESLGTRIKWLNIGLLPALIIVGAVGLGAWRTQRRLSGSA